MTCKLRDVDGGWQKLLWLASVDSRWTAETSETAVTGGGESECEAKRNCEGVRGAIEREGCKLFRLRERKKWSSDGPYVIFRLRDSFVPGF